MHSLTHLAMHVPDVDAMIDFYDRYCGMRVIHERSSEEKKIVWLAEPGREREFIFVLMSGGRPERPPADDYSHLGFAVDSREAVNRLAERARQENRLLWEPREHPWPVGYFCGVVDPNGAYVEFSYGQPLGPGADEYAQQGL